MAAGPVKVKATLSRKINHRRRKRHANPRRHHHQVRLPREPSSLHDPHRHRDDPRAVAVVVVLILASGHDRSKKREIEVVVRSVSSGLEIRNAAIAPPPGGKRMGGRKVVERMPRGASGAGSRAVDRHRFQWRPRSCSRNRFRFRFRCDRWRCERSRNSVMAIT